MKLHNHSQVCLKLVFLCCLLFTFPSFGQDTTGNTYGREPEYWCRLSLAKTNFGPSFGLDLSYAWQGNILSVRYLKGEEFVMSAEGIHDDPLLRLRAIGVLYGRSYRERSLVLSLSAGCGYINVTDRGRQISVHNYEEKKIEGIYLPIEGEARMEITDSLAFIISVVEMVTRKGGYTGGSLGLAVGCF